MSNSTSAQFAKLWSAKLERVKRILRKLPGDLGNESLKFFLDSFKKEQSPDGKPWQPRKQNGSGDRSTRRALLVLSGRLRKSIKLTRVTAIGFSIGSNTPYGKYHNEGAGNIPKREFLGKSVASNRRLMRMIKAKILLALRH